MANNSFGKRLKAYRKAHKLTQRELAEMMDISTNHVSVLEREGKLPRASTIDAFETLAAKDELSKYIEADGLKGLDLEDCVKLVRCLGELAEEKKSEAMEAIIMLLKLM